MDIHTKHVEHENLTAGSAYNLHYMIMDWLKKNNNVTIVDIQYTATAGGWSQGNERTTEYSVNILFRDMKGVQYLPGS